MNETTYRPHNGDGWRLDIRRFGDPRRLAEHRRPVVLVPGYCMNCFILGFHPGGETPLIDSLVSDGFEVWAANMRGQGQSERLGGPKRYGFADLALTDLNSIVEFVIDETKCTPPEPGVDLIGCSLGATVSYVYLAHHPTDHRVGALVNIGGPLRWNRAHPGLRWASQCSPLLRRLPIKGTRMMARLAIPLARRFPWILSHYMNPDIIDLSCAADIVKTIDDPDPKLTAEIADWIKRRDLVVDGLNISHSLYSVDVPIQCVVAMQDGIVTPEAALSVLDHIGSHEVDVVEVGTPEVPHAHADLFVSQGVEHKVFGPIRRWLQAQSGPDAASRGEEEQTDAGAC